MHDLPRLVDPHCRYDPAVWQFIHSPKHLMFMKTMFSPILVVGMLLCAGSAFAQMTVAPNQSANALATALVGSGVTVSNVVLSCPGASNALFSGGGATSVGLNSGVLLTSGSAALVPGQNNVQDASLDTGAPGDAELSAYAGFDTYDRCALEFDFEAIANSVSIRYVFASEEYQEYVNSEFNDVFAFLVTGPNPAGGMYSNVNIATVPMTTTAVAINTINHLTNTTYYIDNPPGVNTTIEYDGLTVILTASVEIVPCASYHFKLAIADASDRILDSGVFLEEASFEATIICRDYTLTLGEDGTGSITAEDLLASDLSACNFSYELSQSDFVCSDEGENTVTVTATDPDGNVLTCDATVTVVVPEGIIDVDLGAACRTVYFGYAPAACTDITATATGGTPPYTYAWSNGEATETINVCPEETTSYSVTVTDANGCVGEAGPVEVRVIDVHCGNNGDKVALCHLPPDNPSNVQSICVAPSAVPDHLSHGDYLGDCSVTADPCALPFVAQSAPVRPDAANLEPSIWPNPGQDRLAVRLPEAAGTTTLVQLLGRNGEVLRQAAMPAGATSAEFSDLFGLPGGTYAIRISDGDGHTWILKWMKLD